jgi:hypothetical protein
MIQDELERLDTQQTKEFYEQPSGSGEITAMEATYPNPLTENTEGDRSCKDQHKQPPKLEWTVDRGDQIIFQQCAFLNGEILSGADGLDNEVSSGARNVDSADCSGSDGASACKFKFNLDDDYEVITMNVLLSDSEQLQNCDVVPITDSSECLPASTLAQVLGNDKQCDNVLCGELCEGDGECGTTNSLNSCGDYDVYRKRCGEVLDISKHSYCVQTKFCPPDSGTCDERNTQIKVTTRCTTVLQYDGTPMDVFPRMLGKEGVSISWLDTRYDDTSGYRVYKYDASVPFAEDTSARLLKEIAVKKADCGLTHDYLDFRDTTTGSEPGLEVGYAIVPLDGAGDEIKDKVGVSGHSSAPSSSGRRRRLQDTNTGGGGGNGFIVTWFADIRVKVEAEGGGLVENVTAKLTRLMPDGTGDVSFYTNFLTDNTNEFGEATLEIRVQDRSWFSKTQHFRVEVEKTSKNANNVDVPHVFSPTSEVVAVRHLSEPTIEFTDTTSTVISGTVSHAGFGAAYFTDGNNCPHKKFQYLADSFLVSGSTDQDQDGTYLLNGMCESLPSYKCDDCSGDQYIWYDTGKWYIGSVNCDTSSAEIRVADANADLEAVSAGSWEEWDGSNFVSKTAISVTTVKYFVVSGSTNHASAHGTYRQLGTCLSVASYKCDDCSGDQYIWYDTPSTKWYIGSINCDTSSAGISVTYANEDLEAVSSTWEEKDTDGTTFNPNNAISVTALTSYTKVDTEECICPVDGVEVWIKRASGPKRVTVNEGKFSTAVFEGEEVTLYLQRYYGVEGTSDCEQDGTSTKNSDGVDHKLHCIEFTDTHGVMQLADVLEVASGSAIEGTCPCPDGYEIWVPRSYEQAQAVYQNVDSKFLWTLDSSADAYGYATTSCSNYLCSRAGLHHFSVTQDAGGATVQQGVWPRFTYTANEDAEVHFVETEYAEPLCRARPQHRGPGIVRERPADRCERRALRLGAAGLDAAGRGQFPARSRQVRRARARGGRGRRGEVPLHARHFVES